MITQETLNNLSRTIRKDIPDFELCFKDRSTLMRVIGFLVFPFNPIFLSGYVTTIGSRVYFPSYSDYASDSVRSFRVLAHEYVHLWDAKQHWWFKLSYLFPQVLAVVPLGLYLFGSVWGWLPVAAALLSYLLACVVCRYHQVVGLMVLSIALVASALGALFLTGWWALLLFGALGCLAPWPSYFRTRWEVRGYGMNLLHMMWSYQMVPQASMESIVREFIGPSYYYMCWSGAKTMALLDAFLVQDNKRLIPPYSRVYDLLTK